MKCRECGAVAPVKVCPFCGTASRATMRVIARDDARRELDKKRVGAHRQANSIAYGRGDAGFGALFGGTP